MFKSTQLSSLIILTLVTLSCSEEAANIDSNNTSKPESKITFDSAYANKLGADEYGMKQYVMAFLISGPNKPKDQLLSDSLQSAHLANIGKMAKEGKLVVAGPF